MRFAPTYKILKDLISGGRGISNICYYNCFY